MTKLILASLAVVALSTAALADDGEGLATPAKGTPERVAYDAADAQYQKDDGNNAYHLEGVKIVDGMPTESSLTIEIDFGSAEDGDYDYTVALKLSGKKWVATQVTKLP